MVDLLEKLQNQDSRLKNIEKLLSLSKSVLTIEEVCTLTKLSKSTIYKFTCLGKIPHFKQAKHLFFDRVEIEAWLKENRGFNVDEIKSEAKNSINIKRKV
jgi:excisionase family DNA binding protein